MGRRPRADAEGSGETPLKARSFKFSDKMRFALRVVARMRHQTEIGVLEEQIKMLADSTKIGRKHWLELYDHDEAIRKLNLIVTPGWAHSADEEEILRFTRMFPQFFFVDDAAVIPHRAYVNILWPQLEHYLQKWRETRSTDYWSVAEDMAEAIQKAKLKPPKFGGNHSQARALA